MAEPLGQPDPRSVFVIHGRNEKTRIAMYAFLRALGLDPMEWPHVLDQEPEPNPDIEHTVSAQLTKAGCVLCLLTPDDIGYLRPELQSPTDPLHDREPTPQPRLNVVYEAGMAMHWDPGKTVLVRLGAVRPISDIGGRHIPLFTGDLKSRLDLIRRLKKTGLDVNDTGTDWHTQGDFDGALELLRKPTSAAPPAESEEDIRLNEIAAEAADKFVEWVSENFGNKPVTASLLATWIEYGWTEKFLDFRYDTLKRMTAKLQDRGHTHLTYLTNREFDGALLKRRNRPKRTHWVQSDDSTY